MYQIIIVMTWGCFAQCNLKSYILVDRLREIIFWITLGVGKAFTNC